MNPILNRNAFFIKEHVGIFKAANSYDILDPENQDVLMECREENLGFFTKIFRFGKHKSKTPFHMEVKTPAGDKVFSVKKKTSWFVATINAYDENDELVGTFKQKLTFLKSKFEVFDASGNLLCLLKGKWTAWDFKFLKDETEFAHVSKEWAGFAKEMFTDADNYMLKINDNVAQDHKMRILIVASALCIDMVLHEG